MKNNLDTRLETLLINKHFEQLTAEEKKYALSFISQEEYNEYSFLLSRAKATLLGNYNELQPSPKTLTTLKQAFNNQQNAKKTPYVNAFAKPVYQALMVAALLIIVIGLFIIRPWGVKTQQLSKNEIKHSEIKPVTNLKTETQLVQTHSKAIQIQKLTASIKTSQKHTIINKLNDTVQKSHESPVYANAMKTNDDDNLCLDVHINSKHLSEAEPSTYVPCLNTMLIIPERDTP